MVNLFGIQGGAMATAVALAAGIGGIVLWLVLSARVRLPYINILKTVFAVTVMFLLVDKVSAATAVTALALKIFVGALSYTALMLLMFRQDISGLIRLRHSAG